MGFASLAALAGGSAPAYAAGSLTIEINAPPNVVVDSNVCSPSTYAPELASIGAGFCNYGDAPLTGVVASIGDFAAGTPGSYPVRDSASFPAGNCLFNSGLYSLTHVGGLNPTTEAVRYIGDLDVGECSWQYWHFVYPHTKNGTQPGACTSGDEVWCAANDPNDDLWLPFDVWATSAEGPSADATWNVTMRSEISASANKIFPNGGDWFMDPDGVAPGEIITTNGINYELGVVHGGYDSDGDGDYDNDAWLQPIGSPSYDPSCFRLVHTSGQLTVTRSSGPDLIIDFSDQLYFSDLPADNTGITGVVYYEFMALSGPCSIPMTPYQEAASGADNEKFCGDYGTPTTTMISTGPEASIDKGVDLAVITPPGQLTYTSVLTNTSATKDFGLPELGMPMVIADAVPPGTAYVAGSATANNSLSFSPNNGLEVIYSITGGTTWTNSEPVPASAVTHLQWRMRDPLPAGASISVEFRVDVAGGYSGAPVIQNTAYASLGIAPPFDQDTVATLVSGAYSISGIVFEDDGGTAGATSPQALNGIYDSGVGEQGIPNVLVTLYWDANGDGVLDGGDLAVATIANSVDGNYSFTNLRAGNWIVVVDPEDPDLPAGYARTTEVELPAPITSGNVTGINFGFGPSLVIDKQLTSPVPPNPALEGTPVTYTIEVTNTRDTTGCTYFTWGETTTAPTSFLSPAYATGAGGPDDLFAYGGEGGAGDDLKVATYNVAASGNITAVRARAVVYLDAPVGNDTVDWTVSDGVLTRTGTISVATLNQHVGAANVGIVEWDVTDLNGDTVGDWAWGDFPNASVQLTFKHTGGPDNVTLFVDAIGFQIATDANCGGEPEDMELVPLTDTYDPALLTLVSSSVPFDSHNPATGVITWNNIGPLLAGESRTITLSFTANQPPDDGDPDSEPDIASFSNTAASTGGRFFNLDPVNDASDTATGTLWPSGAIGDLVWNDADGGGDQDVTEAGIPGVTVELWTDIDADGKIENGDTLVATTTTDALGAYLFRGVRDDPTVAGGTSYVVRVIPASLPGATYTQTGDPDVSPPACGGQSCNNEGPATITLNDGNALNDDNYTRDFGYLIPNSVFGTVWRDRDADATRDATDPGISGVTVWLYNCGTDLTCATATLSQTTTTDATGYYEFGDTAIGNGRYQVRVSTATLPAGGTWAQTYDPDPTLDSRYLTGGNLNLTGGTMSGPWNFGYNQTGSSSISGSVYRDWDGDGAKESGEEGIGSVTVRLYEDLNGNGILDPGTDLLVTTASTDLSTGSFSFSSLPGGSFFVVVDESAAGLASHFQTDDPGEAGTCSVCDALHPVTVTGSSSVANVDFGYQPRGNNSIGDLVWRDDNGNGIPDTGEPGIAGVIMALYEDADGDGVIDPEDALVATYPTAADGTYLFPVLPQTNYIVTVYDDSLIPHDAYGQDYVLSSGSDPRLVTAAMLVAAGGSYLEADFGYAPGAVIGDTVYQDNDGDGDQSLAEPGVSGVTVRLYVDVDSDGVYDPGTDTQLGADQVTDANGTYLFTGIPPGDYVVVVDAGSGSPVNGWTATADPDDPQVGPGNCPACDNQAAVTVLAAGIARYGDFGYQPPGVLGDAVWIDTDGDGVYDPTEAGIAGVEVQLILDDGDGVLEPGGAGGDTWLSLVSTDGNGIYSFGGLADGSYFVYVDPNGDTVPANLVQTYDPDGVVDRVGRVTLSGGLVTSPAGLDNLDIDFGYQVGPRLEIDKDTTTPVISAGGTATYTIRVSNPSTFPTPTGDAVGVTVSDTLPGAGLCAPAAGCFTYASTTSIVPVAATRTATSNPTAGQSSVTWGTWTIQPGGSVTITFVVNVSLATQGGTYDNTSRASATNHRTADDIGEQGQDMDTPAGADPENDEDVTVGFPRLVVTKTAVPAEGTTVDPDQPITYTITIQNAGDAIANNVVVTDPLPAGTEMAVGGYNTQVTVNRWQPPEGSPPDTFADNFDPCPGAGCPNGSDGTLTWSTSWTGGFATSGGDSFLFAGKLPSGDVPISWREVNLSPYASATLRFSYRRVYDAADEYATVEVSPNGGTTWYELQRFVGPANDTDFSRSAAYDIRPYIAANTRIRITMVGYENNEFFGVDNLAIEVRSRVTQAPVAGHDPSGLVIALDGHDLVPGETMTVTYNVKVLGSPPVGLASIDNTAYVTAAELPTPVTDSTTHPLNSGNTGQIGDFVWEDLNNNDVWDAGVDAPLANIRIELFDEGINGIPCDADDSLLFVDLTDANGNYLFSALPSGSTADDYCVNVAESTLPPSYVLISGTEPHPVRDLGIAKVASPYMEADFGYEYQPSPVPVTLASFVASGDERHLVLEWTTETEAGNVGFDLYAWVNDDWQRLNQRLITSRVVDSLTPQTYTFTTSGVSSDAFLLVDVDVRGRTRIHGPFFTGGTEGRRPPAREPVPWPSIAAEHRSKEEARHNAWLQSGSPEAFLDVAADGIYQVTHEDLLAAGIDLSGVALQDLALLQRGQPVPIQVRGIGVWGPGSAIVFVGQAFESLYTDRNRYLLCVDPAAAVRIAYDPTPPPVWTTPTTVYTETVRVEHDLQYSFASPTADPWYELLLIANGEPASADRTIEIDAYVAGAGSPSLTVELWGMTTWPDTSPDHHVLATLNGSLVADDVFDGQVDHPLQADVADEIQEGVNSLTVTVPLDTGVPWELVAVEAYSLTYPRRLVARDGALDFDGQTGAKLYSVSGFTKPAVQVFRVTGSEVWSLNREVVGLPGAYTVRFAASPAPSTYLLANRSSMLTPQIQPAPPQENLFDGQADYLVIAHPDFLGGLDRLTAARSDQGFEVKVVDVEQVYRQYSGGTVDPEAIQAYVRQAARRMGTRYLLLVGGDSYDYTDNLGLGAFSFLPSPYVPSGEIVRFAPADPLYGDVDLDGVPDLAVGRLPVRTSAELETIVDKTLAYQAKDYQRTLVSATDQYDSYSRVSFLEASQELLDQLGADWAVAHGDIDTMGVTGARSALIAALNQGVAVAQYFGHSGPTLWSYLGLFTSADAEALTNQGRPTLVAQWGCWNTYYVEPSFTTMGHKLMLSGDRGAAAVLGAATLTLTESDLALGARFVPRLVTPGTPIGAALVEAKQALAAKHPEMVDVIVGWTILGDPALVVEDGP